MFALQLQLSLNPMGSAAGDRWRNNAGSMGQGNCDSAGIMSTASTRSCAACLVECVSTVKKLAVALCGSKLLSGTSHAMLQRLFPKVLQCK